MTQTATAPPPIHVVQIRDHMAGKRYGNGTCGAEGRTTWLGKGTKTEHVVQGKDHMAGKRYGNGTCGSGEGPHGRKTPNKKPG
ncbi:MAG: hypothetical protein IKI00_06025 [Bacteroidales bacterium]|nr:hypothetical protein [Bacteroidales bacterium]